MRGFVGPAGLVALAALLPNAAGAEDDASTCAAPTPPSFTVPDDGEPVALERVNAAAEAVLAFEADARAAQACLDPVIAAGGPPGAAALGRFNALTEDLQAAWDRYDALSEAWRRANVPAPAGPGGREEAP